MLSIIESPTFKINAYTTVYYKLFRYILQPSNSFFIKNKFFEVFSKKGLTFGFTSAIIVPVPSNIWGYSSAGRALEWHSRGQRFDPAYLHQQKQLIHFGWVVFVYSFVADFAPNLMIDDHEHYPNEILHKASLFEAIQQ